MAGVKSPTNGVRGGPMQMAPSASTPLFNAMGAQIYSPYKAPAATTSREQVQPYVDMANANAKKPAASKPAAAPASGGAMPSFEAINNVVTPKPPQEQQSGQTNDVLAGLMGGQGPDTPQILGSKDQVLRPLGQRMLPMQSFDVAQRGKRVY